MSRGTRAQQGQETVLIAERGWYETSGGKRVDISAAMQSCLARTTLHRPAELEQLVAQLGPTTEPVETIFDVRNETSLGAAQRLVVEQQLSSTLCLNFASARNPGGGFLGGSQAQEESLARSSGLYPSLLTQSDYYNANRNQRSAIYTDHMIVSPDVPVFRDDDGQLLVEPYSLSMITAPAVNAGAMRNNEPHATEQILPKMVERTNKVLALAAHLGYQNLILGAWGCGVFQNDPKSIANIFHAALCHDARFRQRFQHVTFAVLDGTRDQAIVEPFSRVFRR
ncbi:TIGR02452 family protein [Anatilimnocola sp. NA78]|uniref:TIGR02452 family protein n=1 Tax=Anatilimnocola sp. NA78 TaxID=3415683 RepID=UPI003CE48E80